MSLAVYNSAIRKVKGEKLLSRGEKIVHQWRFNNRPVHAGQILSTKILPNGNKKVRLLTAFANDGALGLESVLYSPNGELLEAYAGIRRNSTGTKAISGTMEEVRKFAASQIYYGNPDAKKLIK